MLCANGLRQTLSQNDVSNTANPKTMKPSSILLLVVFLLIGACSQYDCCVLIDDDRSLVGKWQVFEYGYSPGSGYIVEQVPDSPVKILEFKAGGVFSSNYDGLKNFNRYKVEADTSGYVLSLSEILTGRKGTTAAQYTIVGEGDHLKLYYRYCIEGCHIGIKPLR